MVDMISEVETRDTICVEDIKEIAVVVSRTSFPGLVGINVAVVTNGMAMGIVDVCWVVDERTGFG